MASTRRFTAVGALVALTLAAACAQPFDTTRTPPPRGTLGEEMFGVLCDRVGAQALQEDLTGQSFHAVCHKDAAGKWADSVDQSLLPGADPTALDVNGHTVSVDTQNANRLYAVARVEAMARRRGDLVSALDTIFPDTSISVKDLGAADPTKSCGAPPGQGAGTRRLHDELSDLLGRFQALYNDGTLPQSTESLARLFNAVKVAPDADGSFARFEARQGYRPIQLGLGVARPIIAYPHLRDLSNASLALLASDSQPYAVDADGKHKVIPGPANAQLNTLVDVARHELKYATIDPIPETLSDADVDPVLGRTILSRGRTDLETLEKIFYANDPKGRYGKAGVRASYIARRDPYGYALVPSVGGAVPAPFVDVTGPNKKPDGFADTDDLGLFVTTDGTQPPSPFFAQGQAYGTRDACGRALRNAAATGPGGSGGDAGADAGGTPSSDPCAAVDPSSLFYSYVDVQHAFAASLLDDLKPLANADPASKHETLMYALAGAPVLFGDRDGSPASSKCYVTDPKNPATCLDTSSVYQYNGFKASTSPLLDLVYAAGQMLGDPTMDDTLAYVSRLFTNDEAIVARLAGDGLDMKAIADKHPEAHIPAKSVFWDEMLDVVVQVEKEPGLLEDVLKALGADPSAQLGQIFANYMQFNDEVTYDPNGLNGPALNKTLGGNAAMGHPVDRTKPDTGFNRSAMQRFLSLIHDTNGVTACNKDGAVVHTHGINLPLIGNPDLPLGGGTYSECQVFKIENLAKFYLDAIVGKAPLWFRPSIMRTGILGFGAATLGVIEQSSGIGYEYKTPKDGDGVSTNDTTGFFETDLKAPATSPYHPRPQWLNRLVFFDQSTNTQTTDHYYVTQHFLSDLQGAHIGSSVCPERVIKDPCAGDSSCGSNTFDQANVSADGMVHGLRNCADGQWLDQRGPGTIFVWEQFGFYDAIKPLLSVFVNHGREDLFIALMETLYSHWADDKGTADECLYSSDPAAKRTQCTKDGVVTYEPLLAESFQGDIIPALHDLEKVLTTETIPHCTALDASGKCTAADNEDGVAVLSAATRALVDPDLAKAAALASRTGDAKGHRNDGTTNDQVTPIYLLTAALNGLDAAFAAHPSAPSDDRLAQWRLARSQLVDQFLSIDHTGSNWSFHDTAIPAAAPMLVDVLRAQLFAKCKDTFSPPYTGRCAWARDDVTKEMANVISGPTFAATMDLMEAIRTDPPSRAAMGNLLTYLLDAASQNDALPSVLASANDILQLLKDDTNLVPLYHALAPALEQSSDASQKSLVDAQLALLGRISGRAYDGNGTEICANELDPNEVLTVALKNLVTPMPGQSGQTGLTPLQVIMDVIGDVNRADPSKQTKFAATDYASIADNVSDFLLNKERGLEQFYAIVRNGTVSQ